MTARAEAQIAVEAYREHYARCRECRKPCDCPACEDIPGRTAVPCGLGARLLEVAAGKAGGAMIEAREFPTHY